MSKKRKSVLVAAGVEPTAKTKRLTIKELKFVSHYVRTGNASYSAAEAGYAQYKDLRKYASEMLTKPHIALEIEREREKLKEILNIDLQKCLEVLAGQAFTQPSEVLDVISNPENTRAYARLGNKQFGLEIRSVGGQSPGVEARTISPSERRAAANDIIEILGLGKRADKDPGETLLAGLSAIASKLKR